MLFYSTVGGRIAYARLPIIAWFGRMQYTPAAVKKFRAVNLRQQP